MYSKALFRAAETPWLSTLNRISNAYGTAQDSFVITLIDMDENGSYINFSDVVAVSALHDSIAPVIVSNNCNAAYYKPSLEFEFYGTAYKLRDVSTDGQHVSIQKISSGETIKTQTFITDQISSELSIAGIGSYKSENLIEIIQSRHSKYILLNFWSPGCGPCFENIPMLKKFAGEGVGIINIIQMEDDEIAFVEEQITRLDVPGLNFRSSDQLVKYFSQNGFPYSVLIDAQANKILSSDIDLEEHERYINF
ncbi:MAG: thioredoxin domain-containing protein [Saprospiraceae bacterium]